MNRIFDVVVLQWSGNNQVVVATGLPQFRVATEVCFPGNFGVAETNGGEHFFYF